MGGNARLPFTDAADGMASLEDNLGLVIDGRYRLDEVIGVGTMSVVYRGTQLSVGREVAVKVVMPHLATVLCTEFPSAMSGPHSTKLGPSSTISMR